MFNLIVIIVLIPGLVVWAVYKFAPKILWSIPVAALIISGSLLLKDVSSISSEVTFIDKWELYFHNDWSMGFYLIYLPVLVSSVIFTVIAYLIRHFSSSLHNHL